MFIGNVPKSASISNIRSLFEYHNFDVKVKNIRIPRDKETDKLKGIAFVEFYSVAFLDAAIKDGPYELDGNKLNCRKAEDPKPDKRSGELK